MIIKKVVEKIQKPTRIIINSRTIMICVGRNMALEPGYPYTNGSGRIPG